MQRTEIQRLLVTPGVWLTQRRFRALASVYFCLVAPIVVSLHKGVSGL